MLFTATFSLALAGIATASPIIESVKDPLWRRADGQVAAQQDAPAIKGLLTTINNSLTKGDALIKGYTAENSETQSKEIIALLKSTNSQLVSAAKTIEGSKPLGITSVLGLLTPGKALIKSGNQTLIDLQAKLPIIKASKQNDEIAESLRQLKPGVKALAKALPGQVPDSLKGQLQSGAGLPAGTSITVPNDEQLNSLIDQGFDVIVAYLQGKPIPSVSLPAGLTLPSGLAKGLGGAAGAPGAAGAAGGADAPATTGAPKASAPKAPKSGGTPAKGSSPAKTASPKSSTPKSDDSPSEAAPAAPKAAAPKTPKASGAPKAGAAKGTTAKSSGAKPAGGMEGMAGMDM